MSSKYFSLSDSDDLIMKYSEVRVLFYDAKNKKVRIESKNTMFVCPDPDKAIFNQIKAGLEW